MVWSNDGDLSVDELTNVYFNDHRVKRTLKSIGNNSAIALPSLVLLIPVST